MTKECFGLFCVVMAISAELPDTAWSMNSHQKHQLNKLCNAGWNLYCDTKEILRSQESYDKREIYQTIKNMIGKIRGAVDGQISDGNESVKNANILILLLRTLSQEFINF